MPRRWISEQYGSDTQEAVWQSSLRRSSVHGRCRVRMSYLRCHASSTSSSNLGPVELGHLRCGRQRKSESAAPIKGSVSFFSLFGSTLARLRVRSWAVGSLYLLRRSFRSSAAVSSEPYLRRLCGMMMSRKDVAIKCRAYAGSCAVARLSFRGRNDGSRYSSVFFSIQ